MNLLSRLLGMKRSDAPASALPSQADGREHTRATELGQTVTTRRELVRMVVRDTLRYCGIPTEWIDCQVLVLTSRSGETHMYATLALRHWDERLLWHAMALERRIVVELERYEPEARQWLRGIHWHLMADDCPVQAMPDAAYWQLRASAAAAPGRAAPAAARAAAGPSAAVGSGDRAEDDVREDLARLFAVRDAELAAQREADRDGPDRPAFSQTEPAAPGFAPTEPARL